VKKRLIGVALVVLLAVAMFGAWALGRWGALRGSTIPETSADAEPLRWLDHADVIADFTEHIEHQHDTRFMSIYGFSTPGAFGLDDSPEVRQLIQRHGERSVGPAGDVITSAEYFRLRGKAYDYVKRYNILLLHYLREHPDT
jgi:hypothetical protein